MKPDLVPHGFTARCLDMNNDSKLVKHKVSWVVNNVDREWVVMAKDPMDAIKRTQEYLKEK
jgi:ribonuclease HI